MYEPKENIRQNFPTSIHSLLAGPIAKTNKPTFPFIHFCRTNKLEPTNTGFHKMCKFYNPHPLHE